MPFRVFAGMTICRISGVIQSSRQSIPQNRLYFRDICNAIILTYRIKYQIKNLNIISLWIKWGGYFFVAGCNCENSLRLQRKCCAQFHGRAGAWEPDYGKISGDIKDPYRGNCKSTNKSPPSWRGRVRVGGGCHEISILQFHPPLTPSRQGRGNIF